MSYSLYDAAVTPYIQQLGALASIIDIIDKAAAHCAANKIEESVLLQDRLHPDMFCLARQIRQSADFAMNTGGRLAGVAPPPTLIEGSAEPRDSNPKCNVRFGQKQTSWIVEPMSALPAKANMGQHNCDVCFVPKADIGSHFRSSARSRSPP
jgi:hypothetical protein